MELWIRSQDKRQLLKVNDGLYIANGFNNTDDTFIGIKNVGHVGRYAEEERALEVLDEIHQRLINLGTIEIAPDSYIVLPEDTSNVYEMPKE